MMSASADLFVQYYNNIFISEFLMNLLQTCIGLFQTSTCISVISIRFQHGHELRPFITDVSKIFYTHNLFMSLSLSISQKVIKSKKNKHKSNNFDLIRTTTFCLPNIITLPPSLITNNNIQMIRKSISVCRFQL